MAESRTDLKALRNLIAEAHLILTTTELPQGRAERARELLTSALALSDQLLSISPAVALGRTGGLKTARRGPEYFHKIAAMRKEHKGGRPKGKSQH